MVWYAYEYPITTKSLIFHFCLVCGCFISVFIPITTKSSHIHIKLSHSLELYIVTIRSLLPFLTLFFFVFGFCDSVLNTMCLFFVLGWRGARRISVLVNLPARFAVITNRQN